MTLEPFLADEPVRPAGRRRLIPFVLAAAAALAYGAAFTWSQARLAVGDELVRVLVAKADLPERARVPQEGVAVRLIPRRYVSPDAMEASGPFDARLAARMVTRVRVPKGAQLTRSGLEPLSAGQGVSLRVPPGYRAYALPLDLGTLKQARAGDRCDVLAALPARGRVGDRWGPIADRGDMVVATLLKNVLILDVSLEGGGPGKGVATVALNPNEVQYLMLAEKEGEVRIALRGVGDIEDHPMELASFRQLYR